LLPFDAQPVALTVRGIALLLRQRPEADSLARADGEQGWLRFARPNPRLARANAIAKLGLSVSVMLDTDAIGVR
jgi:hypothetical protein